MSTPPLRTPGRAGRDGLWFEDASFLQRNNRGELPASPGQPVFQLRSGAIAAAGTALVFPACGRISARCSELQATEGGLRLSSRACCDSHVAYVVAHRWDHIWLAAPEWLAKVGFKPERCDRAVTIGHRSVNLLLGPAAVSSPRTMLWRGAKQHAASDGVEVTRRLSGGKSVRDLDDGAFRIGVCHVPQPSE